MANESGQPNIKELIDPRSISKSHDQAGRDRLARELIQIRQLRSGTTSRLDNLQEQSDNAERQISQLSKRDSITSRSGKKLSESLVKLKRLIGLGDRRALEMQNQLDLVKDDKEALMATLQQYSDEINELNRVLENTANPKDKLRQYYDSISTEPMTVEEKKKLLKPELLASLTLEEYIKLWRRLNPQFLSHVTRQGFRDHAAMQYHSHGMNELSNGFIALLDDEKILRSPMQIKKLRDRNPETVKQALSEWVLQAENQTEAERRFDKWLNFTFASAPNYPDETAVHLAAQVVADWYYGGETDNEIFYIFPTDAIASQNLFAFNGWEKDFTKPQSETKWNDIFVWPDKDQEGIQLDSGIVFLPKSTRVDRVTGSKYVSQTDQELGKSTLVIDETLASSFHAWCEDKISDSFKLAMQSIESYRTTPDGWYGDRDRARNAATEVVFNQLILLGFSQDAAEDLASEIVPRLSWDTDALEIPELRNLLLEESRALWKRATNPISSQEYWETYFDRNRDKKPKHAVYYDGNPSVAVREFQQRNGIGTSNNGLIEDKLLGFKENHVADMQTDQRAWEGYDELKQLAMQIISDHYGTT